MKAEQVRKELKKLENKKQAKFLQGFFKTGRDEYGEGDIFLGIKVPMQRKVAKRFDDLSLKDIEELLHSKIHEHRLTSLIILCGMYKKADEIMKKKIFGLYLKNTQYINDWDLIDLSSPTIIGNYLLDKDRKVLYKLARSKSLWERRIAIMATFEFIAKGESKDTLAIAGILVDDKHDLIHKAVGWMLREVGKRISQAEEEKFLKKHYKTMPRTMLRYAIEKFDEKKRKFYIGK